MEEQELEVFLEDASSEEVKDLARGLNRKIRAMLEIGKVEVPITGLATLSASLDALSC